MSNHIESDPLAYFEDGLDVLLKEHYHPVDQLTEAINYALNGRGKRVRPMLTMLTCQSLESNIKQAIPAALAVEMIHSYSLIHDDLPCMDDDDLRRGKATVHKVFGESTALLAGDALLTDAFEVLANWNPGALSDKCTLLQMTELSNAAGSRGMVRGQSMDLYWTDRKGATDEDLDDIHLTKTGALMGASCVMGAIAGGAHFDQLSVFRNFGRTIGLAFQIKDDILDTRDGTGKPRGKDSELNKLTYLRFMNDQEALLNAERLTDAAITSIEQLGYKTEALVTYCQTLLNRTH